MISTIIIKTSFKMFTIKIDQGYINSVTDECTVVENKKFKFLFKKFASTK